MAINRGLLESKADFEQRREQETLALEEKAARLVAHYATVGGIPEANIFLETRQPKGESRESFAARVAKAAETTDAAIVDDHTFRGPYKMDIPAGTHAEEIAQKLNDWKIDPYF